jgi:cytochrome c2
MSSDRSGLPVLLAALAGLAVVLGVLFFVLSGPKKPVASNPEPVLPKASPEAKGRALFKQWSCQSCHLEVDTDTGSSLKRLLGKSVELADGTKVVVDAAYLRESVLDPNTKLRKGFEPVMPVYKGRLTAAEVDDLVAYLLVRE